MDAERIDLAEQPGFTLGPLEVRPSTREIIRDGKTEVLEPRVMQVLVALARAKGAVVSKEALTARCWEGRVVGEDAINRVLSRLRRVSEGPGAGAFRVETVTRVGYRLIRLGEDGAASAGAAAPSAGPGLDRRSLLLASGAGILAAAGGAYWLWGNAGTSPPPEAMALLEQAEVAADYGTPEQLATAVGQLQEAAEIAPQWATPWGRLALAYAQQAQQSAPAERQKLLVRSASATRRALELEPRNAEARLAEIVQQRGRRRWIDVDRAFVSILADWPDHPVANTAYGGFLAHVGRVRAANARIARVLTIAGLSPVTGYAYAVNLASAGRLDESDTAMDQVYERWPRHYGVWFSRYKLLLYSGRAEQARAMLAAEASRPVGVPQTNFDLCALEVRAMETRGAADMQAALDAHLAAARTGVGFAQNAMTFASAIGRVDEAFRLADAFFFDRGFQMAERRFTQEQGLYSARRLRPAYFLFSEPHAPMRADRRFTGITQGLGLEDYWRESGVQPDYRAT